MRCKVFKLRLQDEFDESKLNKFLAGVELRQVFASIVNEDGHFWSVLAFYDDEKPAAAAKTQFAKEIAARPPDKTFSIADDAPFPTETAQSEKLAPEPLVLTAEQEINFNRLKKWRNERAAQDGLPPYMIAHNDSLMQIAAASVHSKEELLDIKGFGEKRAEKYGDEILKILNASEVGLV